MPRAGEPLIPLSFMLAYLASAPYPFFKGDTSHPLANVFLRIIQVVATCSILTPLLSRRQISSSNLVSERANSIVCLSQNRAGILGS